MENGTITTPFGRRPLSLDMLASQFRVTEIEPGKTVDKWKLFRNLCEARSSVGISDRALVVLNALLTFYPRTELSEDHGLVVFPSNAQLSVRSHGMAPATLRRHLAALVECGLIIRRDSPNGKRFARRDTSGEIGEAYGFDLVPLLARAGEIESLAGQVLAERQFLRATRERISLCRRDITKLIETGLEEGIAADWGSIHLHFRSLVASIPRTAAAMELTPLLNELEMLRSEIVNLLEIRLKTQKTSGNESQIERHIQNSNPKKPLVSEPRSEKEQGENLDGKPQPSRQTPDPLRSFPLAMVLQACPEILMYGPGGSISGWRDLMAAAVVVRSMLGVSPGAYEEACTILGPENAATVIACILERSGHINSAGGYLRDLTRRAEKGEFSLGPMLMALMRANAVPGRQAG